MKGLTVIILVLLAGFGMFGCGKYNGFVTLDQNVQSKWSQVENQYQRRMDLIGNLVNTVKGAGKFESETLQKVIEARASATQVKVDPAKLTPEAIAQFQKSQDGLSSALGRLLVVNEQYPNLQATAQYKDLAAELAGTENRCAVARKDFNDAVQSYDTQTKYFPGNIFAGMFGFHEKGYFKSAAGADKAPEVKF